MEFYVIIPEMTKIESIIKSDDRFRGKFIRVERTIYIGSLHTSHGNILEAENEDLILEVVARRTKDPDSIDAGKIFVGKKSVVTRDDSVGFSIPLTEEARNRTLALLGEGYSGKKFVSAKYHICRL